MSVSLKLIRTASTYASIDLMQRNIQCYELLGQTLEAPEISARRANEIQKLMSNLRLDDPQVVQNLQTAFDADKATEDGVVALEDLQRIEVLKQEDALPIDIWQIINQYSSRLVQ